MLRFFSILLLGACLLSSGCARRFYGENAEMMHAAKVLAKAINEYHSDYAHWPETIEQARECLPAGTPWPVNPYNGKPIKDTGSPDFDPDTSVGMVYYQRTFRNEVQTNYMLHIYGAKDKLYILGGSAMGVKE